MKITFDFFTVIFKLKKVANVNLTPLLSPSDLYPTEKEKTSRSRTEHISLYEDDITLVEEHVLEMSIKLIFVFLFWACIAGLYLFE